ncbi:MAG: PIN domain-containing protein [Pseudomonadota bacterium]
MKIYFDVCCLNRPFDDQNQVRIHLEAEAVLSIIKFIDDEQCVLVSSDVVTIEINKTVDIERHERLSAINSKAQTYITVNKNILKRIKDIKMMGFTTYDAMHIACSEIAQVDVFLSTDDKLLKCALRNKSDLSVTIENPLTWLQKEFE